MTASYWSEVIPGQCISIATAIPSPPPASLQVGHSVRGRADACNELHPSNEWISAFDSAGDQRPRIVTGVERAQVVDSLTHSDELHGQAELDRDRYRHAAPRAAVELRERDPRDADRIAEQPRLLEPVLSRRRVDDEKRLVRSAVDSSGEDASAPSRAPP